MFRKVFFYIVSAWTIFVMGSYFYAHRDYFSPLNLSLGVTTIKAIVFFILLIGILVFLFQLIVFVGQQFKINKLPFWVLLIIFFLGVVSFGTLRFVWDDFVIYKGPSLIERNGEFLLGPNDSLANDITYLSYGDPLVNPQNSFGPLLEVLEPYFIKTNAPEAILRIIIYVGINLGELLFVLLAIISIGLLSLRLFRFSLPPPTRMAFGLGLGMFILSVLLFGLAQINLFLPQPVLAILIMMIVAGYKELIEIYHYLNKESFLNIKRPNFYNLGLLILLFFIMSLNFIEALIPYPTGFDDYRLYLNLPNLISQNHGFIHGQYSYAFSLIQAIGPTVFNSIVFAKLIIFAIFTLILLPLYIFLRQYFPSGISKIALLITATTPVLYVHSSMQNKPDIVLVFLTLLTFICIQHWLVSKKNKAYRWLILAGVFMGFAFSVKITAAFAIFSMLAMLFAHLFGLSGILLSLGGIIVFLNFGHFGLLGIFSNLIYLVGGMLILGGIIWSAYKYQKKTFSKLMPIMLFMIALFASFSPWMISNAISMEGNFSIMSLARDSSIITPTINWEEAGVDQENCLSTNAVLEDLQRYLGHASSNSVKILSLPWTTTIETSAKTIHAHVGFLFLSFLPLMLIWRYKKELKPKEVSYSMRLFTIGGAIFWVLWMFLASGVIWYGFAGFGFLLLWLTASIYLLEKHSDLMRIFLYVILSIFVVSGCYLRSNLFFSGTNSFMPLFSGLVNYDEFTEYTYPGNEFLSNYFNIEHPESTIITTSNASFFYIVANNENRILFDQFSDNLNCLYHDHNNSLFIERLKKSGFDYLALPVPRYKEGYSEEFLLLEQTVFNLAAENLPLVFTNGHLYLYSLT